MNQRGVIALAAPILMLLVIGVVVFILISRGLVKNPLKSIQLPGQVKEPTVSLQKQYQNPFDKNTRYVNPFSTYQNPFDTLK